MNLNELAKLERKTLFSPCRLYRYTLWRDFGTSFLFDGGNKMKEGFVQFIGLNPSTADETRDDPTIRRCIGFAKSWGYGAMCMTNLFAWRDTSPIGMKREASPIGPENDHWICAIAKEAGIVIAAWGHHGRHLDRAAQVEKLISNLMCLKVTQEGQPSHPLYLPKTLTPIPL